MSLSPQFLDELRARTSLSGLIGRSVKLQRAGREWKACCPFHNEKTPSFTVNEEKGFYHCFGCGAHGDAIRWLTDARGLGFMDAVKELADTAGLEVPAPDPHAQAKAERASGLYDVMEAAAAWFIEQLEGLEGAPARNYLKQRGITEATRQKFGFGYGPDSRDKLRTALKRFGTDKLIEAGLLIQPDGDKQPYDRFRGRLTYPIRDARGRCIAFSARILGQGEPKYLNSPDTPLFDKGRTLFNLDKAGPASREAKRVIVVEGQMDVIALDQAGIREAVAPLGTALTEGQLQKLWQLSDEPILCFDGDAAGRKAAIRASDRALSVLAPGKTLSVATLPTGQDPDDLIAEAGKKGFEEVLSSAKPLSEFVWETELQAEPLDTPEARAALGRRLRDRVRAIPDEDVRIQYLGFINGRLNELFQRFKSGGGGERHHAFIKGQGISPEMIAIWRHGIDQAVMTRAVLQGLRRFPSVIAEYAEAIALIWIKTPQWARVREVMLIAILEHWPLDREKLEFLLRKEGLASHFESLDRTRELAFTFLRNGADDCLAERDLSEVVEKLTAGSSLDAAILAAKRRLQNAEPADWDDAWRELERLYERQRIAEEELLNASEERQTAWQEAFAAEE